MDTVGAGMIAASVLDSLRAKTYQELVSEHFGGHEHQLTLRQSSISVFDEPYAFRVSLRSHGALAPAMSLTAYGFLDRRAQLLRRFKGRGWEAQWAGRERALMAGRLGEAGKINAHSPPEYPTYTQSEPFVTS